MCATPLSVKSRIRFRIGARRSASGASSALASVVLSSGVLGAQVELARAQPGVEDAAHEAVAVAVAAGRGEAEDRVALADRGAVDQPVALDHADAEADQLDLALRVDARHRRGLAAEQRAARAPAALGDRRAAPGARARGRGSPSRRSRGTRAARRPGRRGRSRPSPRSRCRRCRSGRAAAASLSLVPTPSALATKIGFS